MLNLGKYKVNQFGSLKYCYNLKTLDILETPPAHPPGSNYDWQTSPASFNYEAKIQAGVGAPTPKPTPSLPYYINNYVCWKGQDGSATTIKMVSGSNKAQECVNWCSNSIGMSISQLSGNYWDPKSTETSTCSCIKWQGPLPKNPYTEIPTQFISDKYTTNTTTSCLNLPQYCGIPPCESVMCSAPLSVCKNYISGTVAPTPVPTPSTLTQVCVKNTYTGGFYGQTHGLGEKPTYDSTCDYVHSTPIPAIPPITWSSLQT
jgi:hypothetical protein